MVEETLMFRENEQIPLSVKFRHSRELLACYPHPNFPTISLTGGNCALNCKHCGRRYLQNMISCPTPAALREKCFELSSSGATGVLLSGGFNAEGYVPFEPFLDTIEEIKRETVLFISAHTGLVPEWLARELGRVGVDLADFDLIGDDDTIKLVLGVERTVGDYRRSMLLLSRYLPRVVPHICVGLHSGEIRGEFRALELASEIDPPLVVLLVLAPTASTDFEGVNPPSPAIFKEVAATARLMFPQADLALGCMRPRVRERLEIELAALQAGVDRIAMPSKQTIRAAWSMGLIVKELQACCAVPEGVVRPGKSFDPSC
jgi:uncharacterized radical SAM superfamily protein